MRLEQIPNHVLGSFYLGVRDHVDYLAKHDLTEVTTFTFDGGQKLIYVPPNKLVQISERTQPTKGESSG